MRPMATINTGVRSNCVGARVIDVANMTAMAVLSDELAEAGFRWHCEYREGRDVCVGTITCTSGARLWPNDLLRIGSAFGAAGMDLVA